MPPVPSPTGNKGFFLAWKSWRILSFFFLGFVRNPICSYYTSASDKWTTVAVKPICQPSSGIHIVLPDYYSPANMGLLDPNTSDGRVIFFLPWEKVTLAGTTDSPCAVTAHPVPAEKEIQFILKEIRGYLDKAVDGNFSLRSINIPLSVLWLDLL